MAISAKSLFRANVVFMIAERQFSVPDNGAFVALFTGEDAHGAQFVDDPVARTKSLTLPKLGVRVALEGRRLRIEDERGAEPDATLLVAEAHRICQTLFLHTPLEGFGFNIDLFYRFNRLLSITDMFEKFFDKKILVKPDLRDFGFQFTLDRGGNNMDLYFLKVTAPLEIAVHMNRHFTERILPPQEQLLTLFKTCYNDVDTVITHLKA